MSKIPEHIETIESEFIDVSAELSFRGKTNMYVREERSFERILNSAGKKVEGVWEKDWCEVEPGLHTRFDGSGERWGVGSRSRERYNQRQVRIYRSACPVRILFRDVSEYIDYDDSAYSTMTTGREWVRYEAG